MTGETPGVPVWRFLMHDGSVTYRTYKPSAAESTRGVWLPLTAASLSGMRERVEYAVKHALEQITSEYSEREVGYLTDDILSVLGLVAP